MPMAGYSQKSLAGKLGIKEGQRVFFHNSPKGYDKTLGILPDVKKLKSLAGKLDFVQAFVDEPKALAPTFKKVKPFLEKDGMLWISWSKKSSPLFAGVTEDAVRAEGLAAGLVDVKVCAVDDDWSGLKFVYRLKDR